MSTTTQWENKKKNLCSFSYKVRGFNLKNVYQFPSRCSAVHVRWRHRMMVSIPKSGDIDKKPQIFKLSIRLNTLCGKWNYYNCMTGHSFDVSTYLLKFQFVYANTNNLWHQNAIKQFLKRRTITTSNSGIIFPF